jgi:hypothetical protein
VKLRAIVSLAVLSVVGAVLVAGCGGGGSSSSGGGSSSSFASGAEAACTSANKQIAALGTPQQEQVLKYLEATESVIEKLHEEVAGLEGSGSAEVAYTEGLAQAIPVLTKMTNAARNENYDAVRELSEGLVKIHLGELAETANLKSCAEVPVSES